MVWPRLVLLVARLSLTREYSVKREDETHAQIWLEIVMWLASSGGSNRCGHSVSPGFVLIVDVGPGGQEIAAWKGSSIRIRCGGDGVSVGGYLTRRQSDRFNTTSLRLHEPRPHMDRKPASQVGQGEGALAVAAVRGADEVEEGLIFGDGEQLPLAEHPACWSEVASEHAYLTDIGLTHTGNPSFKFCGGNGEARRQPITNITVTLRRARDISGLVILISRERFSEYSSELNRKLTWPALGFF